MNDHSNQSWYHGKISREQTEAILNGKTSGTFLVRDSRSLVGDYVLEVSEGGKISHYIINFKGSYYQIGDQTFQTLPEIIGFYKNYLLDTTTLKEPVAKLEEWKAMFNFDSKDPEDLPFKKGDILTIVKKVEENWWRARDNKGREGMIPKTYVQLISQGSASGQTLASPPKVLTDYLGNRGSRNSLPQERPQVSSIHNSIASRHSNPGDRTQVPNILNDGFEYAVAVMDHFKPYDDSLLSFKIGEYIKIIKKHEDGSWFGELNNKTGKFSFTYVQLLPQDRVNGV